MNDEERLRDEELRFQCLALAQSVDVARDFYAFVKGDKTPRDQINEALDKAGVA